MKIYGIGIDIINILRIKKSLKNRKLLKRLFNNCMRLIAEFIEMRTKENYDYKLQLKKKDYVIAKLKEYIESKDDLDGEIPSDDEEDKKIRR